MHLCPSTSKGATATTMVRQLMITACSILHNLATARGIQLPKPVQRRDRRLPQASGEFRLKRKANLARPRRPEKPWLRSSKSRNRRSRINNERRNWQGDGDLSISGQIDGRRAATGGKPALARNRGR